MCSANAAVAAANLYAQPLIKERGYAWVTSSKVPGGCGKWPASERGPSQGSDPLCQSGTDFLVVRFGTFFQFRPGTIACVNCACDKKGTHKCNLPLISLVPAPVGGQLEVIKSKTVYVFVEVK